jgi:hypothetical protein
MHTRGFPAFVLIHTGKKLSTRYYIIIAEIAGAEQGTGTVAAFIKHRG